MPRSKEPSGLIKSVRLEFASAKPVKLEHRDTPPKFVKPKRIHPRRVRSPHMCSEDDERESLPAKKCQ